MKTVFFIVCAGLWILLATASAQQTALKSHAIPVGDAGVGLVVRLPPSFTMEQPQGTYIYFGRPFRGGLPEIWVYVFVDLKRNIDSTLKEAITPTKRDTTTMQSKSVDWLSWKSVNDVPRGPICHREVYLEHIPALIHDPFKAKRLEGVVVTISIGGLDESEVNAIQKCFVDAELQESTLPPADSKTSDRFVEGDYQLRPGYLAGAYYEFRSGRFTCHYFSDGGSPVPEKGTYKIDGTRLTLFFDTPKLQPVVFYYRVVDGVRLLLPPKCLQSFESQRRFTREEYYISVPGVEPNDRDWWQKLQKQHPQFAKLASEQP